MSQCRDADADGTSKASDSAPPGRKTQRKQKLSKIDHNGLRCRWVPAPVRLLTVISPPDANGHIPLAVCHLPLVSVRASAHFLHLARIVECLGKPLSPPLSPATPVTQPKPELTSAQCEAGAGWKGGGVYPLGAHFILHNLNI